MSKKIFLLGIIIVPWEIPAVLLLSSLLTLI